MDSYTDKVATLSDKPAHLPVDGRTNTVEANHCSFKRPICAAMLALHTLDATLHGSIFEFNMHTLSISDFSVHNSDSYEPTAFRTIHIVAASSHAVSLSLGKRWVKAILIEDRAGYVCRQRDCTRKDDFCLMLLLLLPGGQM